MFCEPLFSWGKLSGDVHNVLFDLGVGLGKLISKLLVVGFQAFDPLLLLQVRSILKFIYFRFGVPNFFLIIWNFWLLGRDSPLNLVELHLHLLFVTFGRFFNLAVWAPSIEQLGSVRAASQAYQLLLKHQISQNSIILLVTVVSIQFEPEKCFLQSEFLTRLLSLSNFVHQRVNFIKNELMFDLGICLLTLLHFWPTLWF